MEPELLPTDEFPIQEMQANRSVNEQVVHTFGGAVRKYAFRKLASPPQGFKSSLRPCVWISLGVLVCRFASWDVAWGMALRKFFGKGLHPE